jgi:hypothetical protein
MLSENNNISRPDDLAENAILVVDGGDGVLNGTDQWIKDSINKRFTHKKNLYSDRAYYYLMLGGNGKRSLGRVG